MYGARRMHNDAQARPRTTIPECDHLNLPSPRLLATCSTLQTCQGTVNAQAESVVLVTILLKPPFLPPFLEGSADVTSYSTFARVVHEYSAVLRVDEEDECYLHVLSLVTAIAVDLCLASAGYNKMYSGASRRLATAILLEMTRWARRIQPQARGSLQQDTNCLSVLLE